MAADGGPTPSTRRGSGRLVSGGLLLGGLFFGACAFVQANDPDPAGWILVYGMTSLVLVLEALGRPRPILPVGLLSVAALWSCILFLGLPDHALPEGLGNEVIRELSGLALVGAAMMGVVVRRRRLSGSATN